MKRVGILGCGDISGIYMKNLKGMFSDRLEIAGICDLLSEKAQGRAREFGIGKIYGDMSEMLADSSVDIVLNLTRPNEHYKTSEAALNAGKHVYSEKTFGADWEEGQRLMALAKEKGRLLGGAPDTFLGAGAQTCRKLIDDGVIGDIVGATAFMVCRGHESWHPSPEFYYKRGGGPMMDMGPYYITALVSLIGPVKSAAGIAKTSFPERTITSEPKNGTVIEVETPTHIAGLMDFACGAAGVILTTFDVFAAQLPRIEIYGSKGTLSVPDPNTFGGPVLLYTADVKAPGAGRFEEVPPAFGYSENSRGLGLYDMARHLEEGTPFRASGELLAHALEIITAFERSYESSAFIRLTTETERPAPMGDAPRAASVCT
ncbi:MAG: Gfo/Idh/MocA family oxidoreductase [Oscillospiraceae bacterium]|nr:Gfo/Idh/MocA family oxidoreductase [Oscillospiraceae bacterium]